MEVKIKNIYICKEKNTCKGKEVVVIHYKSMLRVSSLQD